MIEKPDIPNPLAQYTTVCPDQDKPHDAYINLELIGENAESAYVSFDNHGALGAIAELLWEAAIDLYECQEFGIEHLIEFKGMVTDHELTVDDVLSGRGQQVAPHREGVTHPWDVPLVFRLAQWLEESKFRGCVELQVDADEISIRDLADGSLLWSERS